MDSCVDLVNIVTGKLSDSHLKRSMIYILKHKWFSDMFDQYDNSLTDCIKIFMEWCDNNDIPHNCRDCCIEYYLSFDDKFIQQLNCKKETKENVQQNQTNNNGSCPECKCLNCVIC